jgi:hypothetical protein
MRTAMKRSGGTPFLSDLNLFALSHLFLSSRVIVICHHEIIIVCLCLCLQLSALFVICSMLMRQVRVANGNVRLNYLKKSVLGRLGQITRSYTLNIIILLRKSAQSS